MDKVVILACGGTGRELECLLKPHYNILGFLDDFKTGDRILGTLGDARRFINDHIKLCSSLGSYRTMNRRKEILNAIPINNFINFTSPLALTYPDVGIGKDVIVCPFSTLSTGVDLGNHTFIYHNSVVAHDTRISDYTIVSNSVCISGNVYVGENCYIGAGATILDGVQIGNNCIIAAGATVVSNVESDTIYIAANKVKKNGYANMHHI